MVSRWEGGQREPTLYDLDRICLILHVDLDQLLANLPAWGPGRRISSRAQSWSHRHALGDALIELRVEACLGLWDVFLLTDIETGRIGRIEGGADPSIHEAMELLKVYGRSPTTLMRATKSIRRARLDNVDGTHGHIPRPLNDGA